MKDVIYYFHINFIIIINGWLLYFSTVISLRYTLKNIIINNSFFIDNKNNLYMNDIYVVVHI